MPDHADYDLGQGAGFYVDATEAPWSTHFNMEDLCHARPDRGGGKVRFALDGARARGISGHSMGGHGAISLALKHPGLFKSLSAFAPISALSRCPWGDKALAAYLGPDRDLWRRHDAAALLEASVASALTTSSLIRATRISFSPRSSTLIFWKRRRAHQDRSSPCGGARGYDHGYFFVTSFIEEHIAFHAARLG
ncbi:MAG: alpha/beta hydrolase-fold protein [Terricaulis sp.]